MCVQGSLTLSQICDGAGSCEAGGAFPCAPFACDATGTRCDAPCAGSDAACPQGSYCVGTACTPLKPFGGSCASDHECITGMCISGVCNVRPLPPP
jgi:hypothetical protein